MKKKSKLAPEDRLSRYLLHKGLFSIQNNRVKPNAFIPPKTKSEISVYVTTDRSEQWIWKTGETHVSLPMGKNLLGRADLCVKTPLGLGLAVEVDNVPATGHANISEFPEGRSQRRLKAARLASDAELVINGS